MRCANTHGCTHDIHQHDATGPEMGTCLVGGCPCMEFVVPSFHRAASGDFSIGSEVWPGTSKVLEEMGELGQVLGKLMGTAGRTDHWDGSDLAVRAVEETGDLIAAIEFWSSVNLTIEQRQDQAKRAVVKRRQFEDWHYEQADDQSEATP